MSDTVGVFVGRQRPFTLAHLHNLTEGLKTHQHVFDIVGSVNEAIHYRNPFTFAEVREMIRASLPAAENDRVRILGVEDHDTNIKWVTEVQRIVHEQSAILRFTEKPEISLIGHSKDASSYYLKLFPQWKAHNTTNFGDKLSATALRDSLYEAGMGKDVAWGDPDAATVIERMNRHGELPRGTYLFLREWVHTPAFRQMRDEWYFMEKVYLPQFSQTPYPRFFTAADACVMQSGHTALVRRTVSPGKDLWALAGGHVGIHESFRDASIREFFEETLADKLNSHVDRDFLISHQRGERLLDDPWRSNRMRTVSMAYGYHIPGTTLLNVKGADDASEARMWPNDQIKREMLFEDHYTTFEYFANKFRNI